MDIDISQFASNDDLIDYILNNTIYPKVIVEDMAIPEPPLREVILEDDYLETPESEGTAETEISDSSDFG